MQIRQWASLLIVAMASANTYATSSAANREVDAALINHERIGYWLNLREPERFKGDNIALGAATMQHIEQYQRRNNRQLKQVYRVADGIKPNNLVSKKRHNVMESSVNQAKVLAVLIDFPDLAFDTPGISPPDTDMYYQSYSPAHYIEMLFSDQGFTGADNGTYRSVKQYFAKESGGSFDFVGGLWGWLTADNNAKFYGANTENASDQNVELLVIEAVTKAVAAGLDLSDYDQDQNGIVDHILIFHSSIGEEAGGGVLGEDAIWSHSYSVVNINNGQPMEIVGSTIKIANYTIQPIDAAPGVVAHEFGHDLGLLDEYDLTNTGVGAPVQAWSIMAAGSWVGAIKGTKPSSFSPLAREQLQSSLGGNWVNQIELDALSLTEQPTQFSLTKATNHAGTSNQIKVNLPPGTEQFKLPYDGQHLYYSGDESDREAKLGFTVVLPQSAQLTLSMQAQWSMELDYDYAQLLVNGQPQANSDTAKSSGLIPNVSHYITGQSPLDQWQYLSFDLSAYAGQEVNIELVYVTDPAINEFGIVVDDIKINDGSAIVFSDNAESDSATTLVHFTRIGKDLPKDPRSYYLQFRTIDDIDAGLQTLGYQPGLLLWFGDANYEDNNASEHPGHGFISAVDADQNLIGTHSTSIQLRDAAFSLFDQSEFLADNHLLGHASFNDNDDYSSPMQPQSGVILPIYNLGFEIISQTQESITLELSRQPLAVQAEFSADIEGKLVNFSPSVTNAQSPISYLWNFGDGSTSTASSPSHLFDSYGSYEVSLTITDGAANEQTVRETILVAPPLESEAKASVQTMQALVDVTVSSGVAPFQLLVEFGDGNSQTRTLESFGSVRLDHTYAISGLHEVKVSVTDAMGQVNIESIKLSVSSGLNAAFRQTIDGLAVNFTAEINGGIGAKEILWTFGDGSTSSALNPSHNYASAGSFEVSLSVTDETTLNVVYSRSITLSAVANQGTGEGTVQKSSGGPIGILSLAMLLFYCARRKLFPVHLLIK